MQFLLSERFTKWAALAVVAFSIVATFPAFTIWLGLPPEGDAVDYRVSLVKWLVAHGSVPNWRFTFVDDYPVLGEVLMAFCYAIHRNLMRLVPVLGYIGLALYSAKILVESQSFPRYSNVTVFLLGVAWILALRPVAIQSNLLMVDNLASCFLLGAFYYSLRQNWKSAGLLLALAFSTRYSAWVVAPAFGACAWYLGEGSGRWKNLVQLTAISAIGALPFLWRNWILNQNPFYPMFDHIFNGTEVDIAYFIYGRGRDFLSFLLLPFDMLYTNSFKQAYFDYTVGKLFYLQLFVWIFVIAWKRPILSSISKRSKAIWLFSIVFTVCWFLGSQQMRFFVPALALINLGMLAAILRRVPPIWLTGLVVVGTFSILSIQKDSVLMAIGKRESQFAGGLRMAQQCLAMVPPEEPVGFFKRQGILGFLDHPFRFFPPHEYLAPGSVTNYDEVNFLYTTQSVNGFEPWPKESPCLQKRIGVRL
jgi:hypothetical protein